MKTTSLHKTIWSELQGRRSKLPHALLLVGQKGLGKFALAQAFAAGLLCESPDEHGEACGRCLACNWFSQGNHPDFRLLQPEALEEEASSEEGKKKPSQQITVDQIRALDDFCNVGTHRGGLRIILINPTEAMNRNAANSLLKTLEEPTDNTLFLLVSSDPMRLLPTIRSRCQVVPIRLPEHALALNWLKEANVAEAERWLAMAGGSPLLAFELSNGKQGEWLEIFAKRLASGARLDASLAASEMEKLVKDGKGRLQLKHVVEALQKWLIDLTLAANSTPPRYFLTQQGTMPALAAMIPKARLLQAYRQACRLRVEAEQPLNPRLFLETVFLDYRALFSN